MTSWTQQGMIEAPVSDVWSLIEDPTAFPDWSSEIIDVTGAPTEIEKGSSFQVKARGPLGIKSTTTFQVDEIDELREIKLRCRTSGFYSHWLLTEAQGATFAEVELGVEPLDMKSRVIGAMHTKSYLRKAAEEAIDGLQRALSPGAPRK